MTYYFTAKQSFAAKLCSGASQIALRLVAYALE
jgi:hypothetical protein